jgi:hypothetical protein
MKTIICRACPISLMVKHLSCKEEFRVRFSDWALIIGVYVKHDWRLNENGSRKIVVEQDTYPYCFYIECLRCDDWFCDNGCDGDVLEEECPSQQESLF